MLITWNLPELLLLTLSINMVCVSFKLLLTRDWNASICRRNFQMSDCVYIQSSWRVKKKPTSALTLELAPLTLESTYGIIMTHSSLLALSGVHRNLHFVFRVFWILGLHCHFSTERWTVQDWQAADEDSRDTSARFGLSGRPMQHVSRWVSRCRLPEALIIHHS